MGDRLQSESVIDMRRNPQSRKVYEKGISLSKTAMREVEARLERNPSLPKWDILIRPACTV